MIIVSGITFAVVLHLACGINIPGVRTTEKFDQAVLLDSDGNYILFWNFNDTHVTFEVHVRTKGWVGFGLSDNGNMFPGDVVVGWVTDNGTTHFADRHTVGHRPPIKDKSQDWHLLYGEENDFGTVLKFVRKIDTCDNTEDHVIEEGTNRLIFAYSQRDPADDDSITYHGTRGTNSVSLLSPIITLDSLPADKKHFDFQQDNYLVPANKTTYRCRGFKMPPIGKHHMIQYEPIITPGNENNVHHILIYRCQVNDPDYWDGKSSDCYEKSRTLPQCYDVVIAWAIGGQPFYFPNDVGLSVGGPDDLPFYVMEMHYDNPTQKAHMIDNSGIRITLTPTLRPHEAGLLQVGHDVQYRQIVPPGLRNFVSKSYCSAECLDDGFKQSNLSEFKAFAALQHSHLLGVGIKTRHFRNGVEIKPLIKDPNYDFNFQELRALPKEVTVYPGDSFQVDCTYDSSKRSTVTFGGLSTTDEMCLTFVYYYPKMVLNHCVSAPEFDNFPFQPDELYHTMELTDWTNKTVVDDFVSRLYNTSVTMVCYGQQLKMRWPYQVARPQEPAQPYTPPPAECS